MKHVIRLSPGVLLAALVFPAVGHLLGFSATSFGLWAGTAISDTSSVVAAGYAYSNAAGCRPLKDSSSW